MHGEKGRAELRDAFNAVRDRIADVVQLEVEEDLLAGCARAAAREGEAAGKAELIADLVERDGVAELRRPSPRPRATTADRARRSAGRAGRLPCICSGSRSSRTCRAVSTRSCSDGRQTAGRGARRSACPSRRTPRLPPAIRDLLRDHERAAAELQHLAQREQRAHAAIGAVRGRAEREHAVLDRPRAAARGARARAKSSRAYSSAAA